MGHPTVGDLADAAKRKLGSSCICLSFRKTLGIGRQPDRTWRLDRLRLERDVRELRELAGEWLIVSAPEVAKDRDILDHPLAPLSGCDAQCRAFSVPERARTTAGA